MFLSSCNFKSLNLFKYICYTRTQRKEIEAHNLVFEPYQRFDAIFFHLEVQFSPTIEDLFLKQHVHEPTNMRTRILGWFGKWARISHFLAKPGDREDDFRFALFVRGTREISPVFLVTARIFVVSCVWRHAWLVSLNVTVPSWRCECVTSVLVSVHKDNNDTTLIFVLFNSIPSSHKALR